MDLTEDLFGPFLFLYSISRHTLRGKQCNHIQHYCISDRTLLKNTNTNGRTITPFKLKEKFISQNLDIFELFQILGLLSY